MRKWTGEQVKITATRIRVILERFFGFTFHSLLRKITKGGLRSGRPPAKFIPAYLISAASLKNFSAPGCTGIEIPSRALLRRMLLPLWWAFPTASRSWKRAFVMV